MTGRRYALSRILIAAVSLASAIVVNLFFKDINLAALVFFMVQLGLSFALGSVERSKMIQYLYAGLILVGVAEVLQVLCGALLPADYRIEYCNGAILILCLVLFFAIEMTLAWPRLSKGTRKYLKKKFVWFGITLVVAILLNFFLPRLMRGAGTPWRQDPAVVAETNAKYGEAEATGKIKEEGKTYIPASEWNEHYDTVAREMGVYKERSDKSVTALVNQVVTGEMTDENLVNWRNTYDNFEKQLGREGGMFTELWHFVRHVFDGTFGKSTSKTRSLQSVSSIISDGIIWTIALQIPAILVGWILGNLLGAVAAYRRKLWDKAVMPASLFISAIPAFGSAVILMVIFGMNLKWFPANRAYDAGMIPAFTWKFISNVLLHYQLPFWSIVLISIGGQAVGMRSMSIYELNADYVKYSRFLGIKDRRIVRYVFRNAMLPQVTGLAMSIGTSIGGALVAETIFSYPGLGMKMYQAIGENDFNTVSGIALIITIMVLIAAFLLDLIYAVIDPRVKAAQFD